MCGRKVPEIKDAGELIGNFYKDELRITIELNNKKCKRCMLDVAKVLINQELLKMRVNNGN